MEEKQRIIQEFVPGKQVTLAHVIANPNQEINQKLGLNVEENQQKKKGSALGILTITPSEGAIIAADVATKAADVSIGFIDRFSGAVVLTGDVSAVEASIKEILTVLEQFLGFTPTKVTRT